MRKTINVMHYMSLSWVFLVLSFVIGMIIVAGNMKWASYVYGVGFLNLAIVNFFGKIYLSKVEELPFPIFYLLGMLCPFFLGCTLVLQMEQFFNIQTYVFTYLAWFILSIVHVVSVKSYKDYIKEKHSIKRSTIRYGRHVNCYLED